ncbi:hypothetical protein BD311DRAFT_751925 [Dichomitus squalens]|uniref:Core domain-containing protein n=1 Tax=Dichomitus squalens TaxID=114155 RepID=A0A4Q9MWX7_9APHY|nr:hypothetical protein BD311DRAFT_751925 [Dichomitus squalens]
MTSTSTILFLQQPLSRSLRQFIPAPRRCTHDCSDALRSWYSRASRASAPASAFAPTTSQSASRLSRTNPGICRPASSRTLFTPAGSRRTFVSTSSARAALAQRPPSHQAQIVSYPSPSDIRQEDEDEDVPDIDFVPPEEAVLEMTDRAAEQLRSIAQREKDAAAALRIAVESGGCHGYQYKMELAKRRERDDYHFVHPQIQPSNIYVDAVSMSLLKGSVVDFATELIGSSFRVLDNPQAKGSGCGCGVSWELKL